MDSLYTIHVAPEYRDFIKTTAAVSIILLTLHILMTGQRSTGLLGSLFNTPFSETIAKVMIAIAFLFLVAKKVVAIV